MKDIYDKIKIQDGNLNNPDETILKNYFKQSQPLYRPAAGDNYLIVECFYTTASTGAIYGNL